jgi:hypothetical protein
LHGCLPRDIFRHFERGGGSFPESHAQQDIAWQLARGQQGFERLIYWFNNACLGGKYYSAAQLLNLAA